MELKVFKFGGASVRDAENIRNVGSIINSHKGDKILIVVSAMGKTTNALEEVVRSYWQKTDAVESNILKVKDKHHSVIEELFEDGTAIKGELNDLFVEIDWLIEEEVKDSYDYIYDQIVSVGELLSSKVLSAYLGTTGLRSAWLDVRDIIKTDEIYRGAKVDWDSTLSLAKGGINELFKNADVIVTQGFIGSTNDNQTTTLGREGSDFTASILSYCMDAKEMCIWKDVPGVLTADPRLFKNPIKLDKLTYKEAIEMTYYGAKVIHPKTIKPLENKGIKLYVKPFNDPDGEGTLISSAGSDHYPPVIVVEKDQVLISISSNDFSFIAEDHLSMIFNLLAKYRLKVNLMRNTAISFIVCLTREEDRIAGLKEELEKQFTVTQEKDLELVTVRHYNDETVASLVKSKMVLLEERHMSTIQMVIREVPLQQRIE